LLNATRQLGQFGTTCVLPTLYNVLDDDHLSFLTELAEAIAGVDAAAVPGFHFEGPFMALPGAGAATLPGNVRLLERLYDAVDGRVAAMSISPDTPNILPVIHWLVEHEIVAFITHTQADVKQTQAALAAGARHATHFYDVFYPPEETDPGVRPVGVVEAVLADPRASVDFICDGVHVDPTAVRAALAAKGWEKVILITDSNVGAGLADGVYESPWGYPVKVQQGNGARIHDPARPSHGTLAGSSLTLDRALANALDWLDLPAEQVWAMATRNPARLLGLDGKGTLRPGADADLVLWDKIDGRFRAVRTWVGGRCVFQVE
jgi:N-acetylglucosamine-6-phosphate deacetylase